MRSRPGSTNKRWVWEFWRLKCYCEKRTCKVCRQRIRGREYYRNRLSVAAKSVA